MDTLYFDNNASTIVDPAVLRRMQELFALNLANPASQHRSGRTALRFLEQAKSDLLQLLDAPAEGMETAQVILTSGGTEANNLAILGLSQSSSSFNSREIFVSSIEHPSVLEAASQLRSNVRLLPVDGSGAVDL